MIKKLLGTAIILSCFIATNVNAADEDPVLQKPALAGIVEEISETHNLVQGIIFEKEVEPVVEIVPIKDYGDIELLARVAIAEAGNQSEYGKRLVIDTVLNRVDNEYFDNSIESVVTEKGQYQVVRNGAIWKCTPTDDILNLIYEEIVNRTNSEVIYFRTKHYHSCGHRLFPEGAHYFSGL